MYRIADAWWWLSDHIGSATDRLNLRQRVQLAVAALLCVALTATLLLFGGGRQVADLDDINRQADALLGISPDDPAGADRDDDVDEDALLAPDRPGGNIDPDSVPLPASAASFTLSSAARYLPLSAETRAALAGVFHLDLVAAELELGTTSDRWQGPPFDGDLLDVRWDDTVDGGVALVRADGRRRLLVVVPGEQQPPSDTAAVLSAFGLDPQLYTTSAATLTLLADGRDGTVTVAADGRPTSVDLPLPDGVATSPARNVFAFSLGHPWGVRSPEWYSAAVPTLEQTFDTVALTAAPGSDGAAVGAWQFSGPGGAQITTPATLRGAALRRVTLGTDDPVARRATIDELDDDELEATWRTLRQLLTPPPVTTPRRGSGAIEPETGEAPSSDPDGNGTFPGG